jgi:hypothetical protein
MTEIHSKCPASATALQELVRRGETPERQRSDVRIVSGAPGKHAPRVPGLWRLNFPRDVACDGSFAHRVSGVQMSHVVQQNRLFARRNTL